MTSESILAVRPGQAEAEMRASSGRPTANEASR